MVEKEEKSIFNVIKADWQRCPQCYNVLKSVNGECPICGFVKKLINMKRETEGKNLC